VRSLLRLLSVDEELQSQLQEMKDTGVELQACKAYADRYGEVEIS
jgi:hypothetical protein